MKQDTTFLDQEEVKKQAEATARYERDQKLKLSDMRKILSIPEGRRVIWGLLEKAGVFTPSFSLNTLQMAFNEGVRSVGIYLLADVEVAKPGSYTQMFNEYISKEKSAKSKEKEDARTNSDN